MVTGRKYSAKTRCFTAVIFDPVTEIMSSLPRCNHQTISEIWSKCTMRRLARGATLCLCAPLFICALWSPAGKGLTSWLSFVVSAVSLSLSHWYPGSGVVLDCIDS